MNTFIVSSNWQKSGIKDPAKMISGVFTRDSLMCYRWFIEDAVQSAFSFQKIEYNKKILSHFFKMQEAAIIAASLITLKEPKSSVIIKATHLNQFTHYTIQEEEQAQWDDIPRQLTSDEVLNPYLTLDIFFKTHDLKTWQIVLKKLYYYSRTKKCLFHDPFSINPITVSKHLVELTEALHLIYVREIYPATNMLPPDTDALETEQETLVQV